MLLCCSHMHANSKPRTIHIVSHSNTNVGSKGWISGVEYLRLTLTCLTFRSFQTLSVGFKRQKSWKEKCVQMELGTLLKAAAVAILQWIHVCYFPEVHGKIFSRKLSAPIHKINKWCLLTLKKKKKKVQGHVLFQLYHPKTWLILLSQIQFLHISIPNSPSSLGQGWMQLQVPTAWQDTQK